jgi:hypothetical protein
MLNTAGSLVHLIVLVMMMLLAGRAGWLSGQACPAAA